MANSPFDHSSVMQALSDFQDPETGRGIVQMDQVHDVQLGSDSISLTLGLTTHSAPLWQETKSALEQHLRNRFQQLKTVQIKLAEHVRPPQRLGTIGLAAKSVIAVGSGKGGVGKSTIAASIALGLNR